MEIKIYKTSKDSWDAIYTDCMYAKESIYFEQFIISDFKKGGIGSRFEQLFIAKAQKGLKVRLLLDVWGSLGFFSSRSFSNMKKAGVDIRISPANLMVGKFSFSLRFKRNHRKLVVIDDDISYIGGVVFCEEVRLWNDLQVSFRRDNMAFKKSFELMWLGLPVDESTQNFSIENSETRLISSSHHSLYIYKEVLDRIKKAEQEIIIITPYFSPPKEIWKAMELSVKKGVNIKICVPEKTNHFVAHMTHCSFKKKINKAGISFLSLKKMNHAKVIKIDDWTTFGSCNFDMLSFFHNKELNIATNNHTILKLISSVIGDFTKDGEVFFEKNKNCWFLGLIGFWFRRII